VLSEAMEILPMTKLSDTHLVILGAAAQRPDLAVLPLPETLTLKGGALAKVIDSLRNRGLIRVIGADGGPERVVITSEGMAAIRVESEGGEEAPAGAAEPDTAPTSADAGATGGGLTEAAEADTAPTPASHKASLKTKAAKAPPAATEPQAAPGRPSGKPTPRAGTKQAVMIEMLKRPEGATVEQIAAATGVEWRRSALPPCGDRFLRPPLRTGRASFPASGSPCSAYG
jgi:Protein of unknown function (DUF3489)